MNIQSAVISEKPAPQPTGLLQHLYKHTLTHPEKIAIIEYERNITYHALTCEAESIARGLIKRGISLEKPVAILMSPGIEQIICQLAILIARGTCLPLDPSLPEERLNTMLEDVQANWTIVSPGNNHSQLQTQTLTLDELRSAPDNGEHRVINIAQNHRTHFLFTSGTTGRPKAVEIEAKGILRLVVDTHYIQFSAEDRIACIANPTFDASLFEIWGALLNGATLVIINKNDVLDIHRFAQTLTDRSITIMFITASLFNLVATTAPHAFGLFRYVLVGGEALNPHTLKRVLQVAAPQHLINGYGPTESTTFALTHLITEADLNGGSVPIGRPIDRTSAFILDDNLCPVAPGKTGHLYIGGDGLARGYWNREELNRERFVEVSIEGHTEPLRLYKTGDLCVQRDDGIFLYCGRLDNQVKIRGHRVELEEIESQLLKSIEVKAAAAALVKTEGSVPYLAAFVVPWQPETFNAHALNQALSQHLPEYMLPRLVVVDEIPLSPTGKTDRNRLIAQLANRPTTNQRPESLTDTEYKLLVIWRKLLNIDAIDLGENFFELGGSSLHAASLIIEINRAFNKQLSVKTLYNAPTLRELACAVVHDDASLNADDSAQWLSDAQLPEDIQPLNDTPTNWALLDDTTVFMTGATGYLGAFFLRDLLLQPTVGKVVCLIRATDNTVALQRIEQNLAQYGLWQPTYRECICALAGDLSRSQLGLETHTYQQLAREADVIFHLGAHVNYIQPYQAHRAANIEGTLNVLRLATQIKSKPLHYISTIAAYGPAGLFNHSKRIYENDDLAPYMEGLKYDSGYSQSQWVVEQFVWEARARGIPLSVYRPGFIVGDSINGAGNPKDFVARLIRGCITIGAYPALPKQRKEFIPVDYVSAALMIIARDERNLGQAYHLVPPDHNQSIDLEHFFELLPQAGYPLQKLPYAQWIARLEADPNLDQNPLMPLLPMLAEAVYQHKTRWEVYENMPAYDASNTLAALAAAGQPLVFTPMDIHLLTRHLKYWQACGALPPTPK
jgi:amino acid adenylation domain-containing protein/thioester reductase-like protein